jgi:cytochrome c55X
MWVRSLICAFLLSLCVTGALATEPDAARRDELIHRLRHDCGSCHGLTLKGGLGPALLPADLVERDNDVLLDVIMNGIPGTPMPPWKFELSESEARWLIAKLKKGL